MRRWRLRLALSPVDVDILVRVLRRRIGRRCDGSKLEARGRADVVVVKPRLPIAGRRRRRR